MQTSKTRSGFTLLELLFCLGIAGVACVVVLAQFRTRRDEQLARAARQIMAELLSAQSQAIEQHKPQIARIDAPAGGGPTVASANFDGQSAVAFDDLGMPYSYCPKTRKLAPLSDGTVVVKYGPDQMTVRILPITGQIQVQ